MKNRLVEAAKKAISEVNGDTSVSPERTLERLDEIDEWLQPYRAALKDQMANVKENQE